jgi:acid phosphatase
MRIVTGSSIRNETVEYLGGDAFSMIAERLLKLSLVVVVIGIMILGLLIVPSHVYASNPVSGKYFDYVVTVLMENTGINKTYHYDSCNGCYVIGNANASFMNSFVSTHGFAIGYAGVTHPSAPNYEALLGGETTFYPIDGLGNWKDPGYSLVDRLESKSVSWKAYAENAGGSGTCSFNPPRGSDHFPFLMFLRNNVVSRCQNFLSTTASSDKELLSDLGGPNPANFYWLTPTDLHNCHDVPLSISSACDIYLRNLVNAILSSSTFTTKRAALIITFDEGGGPSPGNYVYTVIAGPQARASYKSATGYNHYSWLHLIEDNWSTSTLTSNDAGASVMSEFFRSDFTLSANPGTVAVSLNTPGTSAITVTPTGGFNAQVSFSTRASPGTGLVCQTMNPVSGGTGSSTLSCTGSTAQSYTVTVTGTSGSLSNQVNVSFTISQSGTMVLSNNPRNAANWTVVSGTWTQQGGAIDAVGGWAELKSRAGFSSDRTVTVRAITLTGGPYVYNAAWVRGKYVDGSNSIALILHRNGTTELQFKQTGRTSWSFTNSTPTGLNPSAWHTFKMVFSGNNVRAYVDGALDLNVNDGLVGTLGGARIDLENGGSSVHSQFANATISPNIPDFTVAATSPSAVTSGQSATSTITITAWNGFTGSVAMSDNPLPNGLVCQAVSPTSVTLPPSPATARLTCSSKVAGSYVVTITGTSGSLTRRSTVTFTFKP